MKKISWKRYIKDIDILVKEIKKSKIKYGCVLGISKGGNIPATIIATKLGIPLSILSVSSYNGRAQEQVVCDMSVSNSSAFTRVTKRLLVVDDLVDSGTTLEYLVDTLKRPFDFAVLYNKSEYAPTYQVSKMKEDEWIVFPYEEK